MIFTVCVCVGGGGSFISHGNMMVKLEFGFFYCKVTVWMSSFCVCFTVVLHTAHL